jgi:hypothetical protein
MELLRRKKEGTGVISVRLPGSIYAKLVEQRRRAKLLGFNFNATLAGLLSEGTKQIHQELIDAERKASGGSDRGTTKRARSQSAAEWMAG